MEQQISMITEYFEIYNEIESGLYVWGGIKKENGYHHHGEFDIDEKCASYRSCTICGICT